MASAERLESRWALSGEPTVTVDTNFGDFQIELRPDAAPQTVANFLSYVESGAYTNSIFHRSVPGFVEQSGGFTSSSATFSSTSQFSTIPTKAPIPLEYNLPNIVGSVGMARTANPNSATDEWFINLVDNSSTLGPQADGHGYAVFGQVLGNGMQVIDKIASLSVDNADNGAFSQLPLGPNNQLVQISSITLDSIDGTVFADVNGNGQLDSGETGIAGRTVFLNLDGTGQPDANNPSTTTDANGNYSFAGLAPGTYTVEEVVPFGQTATTPSQVVVVTANATASGVNLGELARPSIRGTVFDDANDNGRLDPGETGIAGRTVFLNLDGTGQPDARNPSTTTDANGNYSFSGLPPGSYTVEEVVPAGHTATTPSQAVTVTANANVFGVNFGEFVGSSISGTVFNDVNVNGRRDGGEGGLAGVRVFLDLDGSGVPDAVNPSTITDASGDFTFSGIAPGTYSVRQVLPGFGVIATTQPVVVTVVEGQTATADFGDLLTSTILSLPITLESSATSSDANTAFINSVYVSLLGHQADAAGLAFWQRQLAGGASRANVAQGVWDSAEHRALEINAFYHDFLSRAPDDAGRAYWLGLFPLLGEKGEVAAFVTSAEFSQLHASDADFVAAMYDEIALRPADNAGTDYWAGKLAGGETRAQVALAFIDSPEATNRLVDELYSALLHRAADSASQQHWASAIEQNTLSVENAGIGFLASDEYFNQAAGKRN